MAETKNLCAQIPIPLHERVSEERERLGQTTSEYITQLIQEYYNTSDTAESEARMSGYYGLDMSRIESWAAESNASSSLNADCAVVLKVKDGYAADAAALLQQSFDQVVSYARMYDMDLQRVLQGRLYISGNYVALILEGAKPDGSASAEEQAKFAADEAAKADEVWRGIFGSADNGITIPEEDGSNNNSGFFDMTDDEGNNDPVLGG